jgi:hypothetical protein
VITVKLTKRQLWSLICAQNALAVELARGDNWSMTTVGLHMRADGVEPLTVAESDRLIRRLEKRLDD